MSIPLDRSGWPISSVSYIEAFPTVGARWHGWVHGWADASEKGGFVLAVMDTKGRMRHVHARRVMVRKPTLTAISKRREIEARMGHASKKALRQLRSLTEKPR